MGAEVTDTAPANEWSPPIPLLTALEQLRLDGAIFFRAEFTEQWSFASPLREITPLLHPGASRMILFHVVAAGRCWVSLEGGERHWASKGDVIVLPYGDDYLMGGTEAAETVPIFSLLSGPPWASMPVVDARRGRRAHRPRVRSPAFGRRVVRSGHRRVATGVRRASR